MGVPIGRGSIALVGVGSGAGDPDPTILHPSRGESKRMFTKLHPNPSGMTALPTQMQSVQDLLSQILVKLTSIEGQDNVQSEQREDEVIYASFSSDGPLIFQSQVQLRIRALVVYTVTAGLHRVQIGNDANYPFLGTVNGQVVVFRGDEQRIIIARGLPITVIPPTPPGTGAWYAQLFAVSGTTYGSFGPR